MWYSIKILPNLLNYTKCEKHSTLLLYAAFNHDFFLFTWSPNQNYKNCKIKMREFFLTNLDKNSMDRTLWRKKKDAWYKALVVHAHSYSTITTLTLIRLRAPYCIGSIHANLQLYLNKKKHASNQKFI